MGDDSGGTRLLRYAIYIIVPIVAICFSLSLGRYDIPVVTVFKILLSPFTSVSQTWPPVMNKVIFDVRLPRVIAAMLVGAGLAISGAAFQGLFRNPLVSPYILGVSAGAGFGAALAILLSRTVIIIQLWAFVFGLMSVGIAYGISRVHRQPSDVVLVLAGVIVGAFFTALISFIKYIADPYEKLPAIVFWLMGSFAAVNTRQLLTLVLPIVAAIIVLLLIRWRINSLSLGDEEAESLGVNTRRLKAVVIVCATLITAASVALCGIIGWVGLVIPHVGRMLVGPDHARLLPICLLLGGVYLLMVDNLARTLTTAEIPVGILTAIIGAPFFAYLLCRRDVGW